MSLTFIFVSIVNVKKYIYSLAYNYLSHLVNSTKKKPSLPPKRNIGNIGKNKKNIMVKKNTKKSQDFIHKDTKEPEENKNNINEKLNDIQIIQTIEEDLLVPREKEVRKNPPKNYKNSTQNFLRNI